MPALVLGDGHRIALSVADTRVTRRRGLLRRDSAGGGALLITKCRSVHTFGMRFAIDVAYLDATMHVLRVRTMPPQRLGSPMLRSRHVLEADAGAFAQWQLAVGDHLQVKL